MPNRLRVVPGFQTHRPEFCDGGGEATIRLTEELGSVILPVGESKARFTDELARHLNPPGSGGLLVALHVWQRLLTVGPKKFGEVYYLGTMPIPSHQALVDVLVGKTILALQQQGLSRVILGGGVSANSALRQEMSRACQEAGAELFLAPPAYCTDNAAMVAGLAYHKLRAGLSADLGLTAQA